MENIKSFEEFHRVDEAKNVKGDKDWKQLISALKQAVDAAENLGIKAQEDEIEGTDRGDYFMGSEGNEVSSYLMQIYAGLSTGDRKDDSQNDEIFK